MPTAQFTAFNTHLNINSLPNNVPTRHNPILQKWAKKFLSRLGWSICGEVPNVNKAIVILAPHTSNKDGLLGILAILALDIKISLLGKHSLYIPPLKWVLDYLDFIPVNRDTHSNLVQYIVKQYHNRNSLWLAMAPEGTRHNAKQWKTGFYQIAHQAHIPIVLLGIDYKLKQIQLIGSFNPSGNKQEINSLINHIKHIHPAHPRRLSQPIIQQQSTQ